MREGEAEGIFKIYQRVRLLCVNFNQNEITSFINIAFFIANN